MTLGPDRLTRYRWLMLFPDKGNSGGNSKDSASSDSSDADSDDSDSDDDSDDSEDDDADDDDSDEDDDDADDDKPAMTVEEKKAYKAQLRKNLSAEIRREIKAEADKDDAKKQGNYKKLYEDAQSEIDKLKGEIETDKIARMREKIGAEFNLPQRIIDKLSGSTEKEIKADAKAIAEDLKIERKAPDNEGGKGAKGGNGNNKKPTPRKRTYAFQRPGDVSWGSASDKE